MSENITAGDTQQVLDATLGVLFIGFMLSTVLYGLSTFQMHIYFTQFPKDNRLIKLFVLFIWLIETAASTMISRMHYYYLIDCLTLSFEELKVTNTFLAENGLAGLAVLLVHLFYAFRIWAVSEKTIILPTLIVATAIGSFVLTTIATAKLAGRQYMATLLTPEIELLLGVAGGLSIVCNLFIVASQAYYLRPSRQPNMTPPSSWLHRLLLALAGRGTVFTLLHIALIATLVSMPHSQVWILLHFIVSKVYINSLFAMLNMRKAEKGRGINEEDNLKSPDGQKSLSWLVAGGAVPEISRVGHSLTVGWTRTGSSIASVRTRSNSATTQGELPLQSPSPKSTLNMDGHREEPRVSPVSALSFLKEIHSAIPSQY